MEECPNCWGDTAFTPLADVQKMLNAGMENRVLFGTDYPLQKVFYPDEDILSCYSSTVRSMQTIMSVEQWGKISHMNFQKLYNIY